MKTKKQGFIGLFSVVILAMVLVTACADKGPIYQNPKADVEDRIADLVERMTLDEKVVMVTGAARTITKEVNGKDSIIDRQEALKRLGIPPLKVEHGPFGFKGDMGLNGPRVSGTYFPVSIAQAATWDREMVEKVNAAMGAEMHTAGGHLNAGPAMNIIRDPRTGRSFEYFTEDPYLNGQIAAAYSRGLQSQKVMANLKHYVANNQEMNRGLLNVKVDERTLREIYLPGFKAAIEEGGAWSLMGAYNKVNGYYCNENPFLLTKVLREDWNFKGFVLSDYSGTHSTADAANAGLDLEMPRELWYGKKLFKAVEAGEVTMETLDFMVSNILRGLFWTGAFEEEPALDESLLNCEAHRKVAREASAASMVLLKNEKKVLPLDKEKIKKLAVIGPHGEYGIHYNNGAYKPQLLQGNGSSRMNVGRDRMVTPLDGIMTHSNGSYEVEFAPGCYAESGCGNIPLKYLRTPDGKTEGMQVTYFANATFEGKPVKKEITTELSHMWRGELDIPEEGLDMDDKNRFSIEFKSILTAPETREYTFEVRNEAGFAQLFINGKLIAENKDGNRTFWNDMGSIKLEKGKKYDLLVRFAKTGAKADLRIGWDYENVAWMKEAIALAKNSDAVLLNVGLTGNMGETEGGDRRHLSLFPAQENLINEITKVNPNVVVVLVAGSAVTMDAWIENASTVLLAWYPGQEGGHALADVVFGDVNPSGRLPITFPKSLEQYPDDFYTQEFEITYNDGIYVGYRYFDENNLETTFPFGYGLSYTSFEYSNLKVATAGKGKVKVSLDVKNTGDKDGAEIVQLYVTDLESSVDRPEKELKDFRKMMIKTGEVETVEFTLDKGAFAFWDDSKKEWTVEAGEFEILVGTTSKDIRLSETFEMK